MNGILSKEKKELDWKNVWSDSLLSIVFENTEDVTIDKSHNAIGLIKQILYTNDYNEKITLFNKVRLEVNSQYYNEQNLMYPFIHFIHFAFKDFFKDPNITNSVITNKKDKVLLINILVGIFKLLLLFPKHLKIYNSKETIAGIRTKMTGQALLNSPVNYLQGDYDESRLSDFTGSDPLRIYISSIDSYYFLAKKHDIQDGNLYLLFDVYDNMESIESNSKLSPEFNNILKELKTIIASIIQTNYELNVDALF